MSHLYFTKSIIKNTALLENDDAAHLARVLRAKPGDILTLCDGKGMEYEARLTEVSAQSAAAEILSSKKSASEPTIEVTLYAGLPKGDKLELIIQKATELGAVRIVPFVSEFCVAKPKNEDKKAERWGKIAKEAAKQSARGRIPEVSAPISFAQLLREVKNEDVSFFFYERGGEPLFCNHQVHSRLADAKSISVITGAEGGFSPKEAQQAEQAGCVLAGLGPRILRCETAPLAALSALMVLTGNL